MAEALLLGLDVVATGYSGNMDFCRDNPHAHLAHYRLVPVRKGEYPFGEGQCWAEPDIGHAAELMRGCATNRAINEYQKEHIFSIKNAGAEYRRRLRAVWHRIAAKARGEIYV